MGPIPMFYDSEESRREREAERRAKEVKDWEYRQYRRTLSFKKWASFAAVFVFATGTILLLPEHPFWALLLSVCEVIAAFCYYVYSLSDSYSAGCSDARKKVFGSD